MNRIVCTACGGWIDTGTDFTSWPARSAAFNAAHAHPAGAPVVYRWNGTEADRDAWSAVVNALGLISWGFAPIGRSAIAHVSKGAGANTPMLRVAAENVTELTKALAAL